MRMMLFLERILSFNRYHVSEIIVNGYETI